MKLRLGGKGYAPDPNCALGQHIKGLGEFVTLMQRMEEVIEEDQDIRSVSCNCDIYEPRREKTGLRGFLPGLTQTGLYSDRSKLEA